MYGVLRKHGSDTLRCPLRIKTAWEVGLCLFSEKRQTPLHSLNVIGKAFRNAELCPNSSLFKAGDKTAITICEGTKPPMLSPSHRH